MFSAVRRRPAERFVSASLAGAGGGTGGRQAVSPAQRRIPVPVRHVRQFRCSGGGQVVRRLFQQVPRPAAIRVALGERRRCRRLDEPPRSTAFLRVHPHGCRRRASPARFGVLRRPPRQPSESDDQAVRTRTAGHLKVLAPLGSEDGRDAAGASEADRSMRSKYAAYLHGNRLIYENRNCIREDDTTVRGSR